MEQIRRFGIAALTLLLLGNLLTPEAWAQGAPPEGAPPAKEESSSGQDVAAGFANVLYIPGKAIACGLSALFYGGWMVVTLGGGYKDKNATQIINGGCGGKWVLKGEDMPSNR
jgi:hypothetical protein